MATDDLALLPSLNDASVVELLEQRFKGRQIYTRVNQMLLSINPYEELGLYTAEALERHRRVGTGGPPPEPHAFAVAAEAFTGLLSAQSQSVLVTGESGAGKTETCRRLLQYLAHAAAAGGSGDTRRLHEALIHTSCVLEAFGNARTVMNDNSSRYGKFLMLRYDSTARLRAAAFSTFLLEKTRVVRIAPGERNYHVFYALLAGLKPLEAAELSLLHEPAVPGGTLRPLGPKAFAYTSCAAEQPTSAAAAALAAEAKRDKGALRDIGRALDALGLAHYEQWQAWQVLAAILHLGNVQLAAKASPDGSASDTAELRDAAAVTAAATLLGLTADALSGVLLTRCIRAGSDFVTTPNSAPAAGLLRDGLAKALYSRLFERVVAGINRSPAICGADGVDAGAAAGDGELSGRPFIGMLDIFGFEDFETNSLEQLLINYSNEHLQAIFNEIIFAAAQAEAVEEGVPPPTFDAEAVSNSSTLALFSTPHRGLFSLLNEECVFPKGTDASFSDKFAAANKDNARLTVLPPAAGKSRGASFAVSHYAGSVVYSSAGFLVKNKDPFSEDLLVLLRGSKAPYVSSLFAPPPADQQARAGRRGFRGVVGTYASELDQLLRVIAGSRAHFVRCVKPNTFKAARRFERDVVLRQLRCGGVLEAVRVFSSGYPDRLPIREFVGTYRALVPALELPPAGAAGAATAADRRACADILRALGFGDGSVALGKTKVFLAAGVVAQCRARRDAKVATCVVACQAGARGLLARQGTREARSRQQARAREEAREREIEALAARQEAERAAARDAADARAAVLRAREEEARRREEAEAAEAAARAARQSASWEARGAELAAVNASLASESGRKQAELRAQLDRLTQLLRVAEEKSANLESALSQERAAAGAQEAELQASVSMWRDEAGLAAQRERQAVQMAAARLSQADEKAGELRDEAAFFRARFQELVLSFARGDGQVGPPLGPPPARAGGKAGGASNLLDGISSWAGSLLAPTKAGGSARGRARPPPPPPLAPPPPPRGFGRPARGGGTFSAIAEEEESWTPRLRSPPKTQRGGSGGAAASATAAYAAYLGLDPERDASLMWIATAAATEPLPDGWTESRDPEGRPYYQSSVTGEASRQHPRDDEFRQLVVLSKLALLHSAAKATPSAGDWSTVAMKSMEQSLCSAASVPVRAVVNRSQPAAAAPPRFTFEMRLDEDTLLPWMDAVLCEPGVHGTVFELTFEQAAGRVRHHQVRLRHGAYTLVRSSAGSDSVEEELAAVQFVEGPGVGSHTMELIVPKMKRDGVVVAHVPRGEAGSLAEAYARAETRDVLVFVGRVEVAAPADAAPSYGARLSLPKTDSGNLLLQKPGRRGPCRAMLEYHEPLAPVQAFLCALAIIHWTERGHAAAGRTVH